MLKIKDMNLNSVIRQGDSQPREYQLDTGNLDLNLTNESATIRLMTADFQGIGYETTATVSSENKISFSIDDVIPAREYRLEITVDDYVFPSRATDGQFSIDPSSHGQEVNIIQIIGKDEIVREVKEQLEPFLGEIEQAELDRQADKVVIKNLIENGSFANNFDRWKIGSAMELESNIIKTAPNSAKQTSRNQSVYQDITANNGDKMYVSGWVFSVSGGLPVIKLFGRGSFSNTLPQLDGSKVGEWEHISVIQEASNGGVRAMLGHYSADIALEVYYDDILCINLTETFGAGNEPTKEEMDKLIEITGYIDGEYALNNKEVLSYVINSIGEFPIVKSKSEEAITKASQADNLSKSVQSQFNQVVIEGDSSVESAQARVDTSGQTNPTLKARLDKEHNEVTTQLAHNHNEVTTQLAHNENFKLNVSVHDFLCDDGEYVKGDGIHDDTTGIQRALDYCHENNRKLIFSRQKTYMVSQCFLYEGIHIEGNGATLKMLPDRPRSSRLLTMQNNYRYSGDVDSKVITISNLVFDGNCYNQGDFTNYEKEQQFGLFLEGDAQREGRVRANISNCVFQDFCGDGMHFYTNTFVNCENIIASQCFRGCVVVSGGNSVFNINNYLNISDWGNGLDVEVDILGYNGKGIIANISNVTTNRNCDFGNIKSEDNKFNITNMNALEGRINITVYGDVNVSNSQFNNVETVLCFNVNFDNCVFNSEITGESFTSLNSRSPDSTTDFTRDKYNTKVSNCVFKFNGEKGEDVTGTSIRGYLVNLSVSNCRFENSVDKAIHLEGICRGIIQNNIIESKLGTEYLTRAWAQNELLWVKDNVYPIEATTPHKVVNAGVLGEKVYIDETYTFDNHINVDKHADHSMYGNFYNNRTLITTINPTTVDLFGLKNDICISLDKQSKWICTKTGGGMSNWKAL